MEQKKHLSLRHENLLKVLSSLPSKILASYYRTNLTDFVLYELAHPECFNLSKAAYFVDNPDFNCLKGVVGLSQVDHKSHDQDIWTNDQFAQDMHGSTFNQKVRHTSLPSIGHASDYNSASLAELAAQLSITRPHYYSWHLKHDNHGILIFEHPHNYQEDYEPHTLHGFSLLGFCPIC